MKKNVIHPCQGCKYFIACGNTSRTEYCAGRETKGLGKMKVRKQYEDELREFRWEEWMISVTNYNAKRVSEIRDRIAYIENLLRNCEA